MVAEGGGYRTSLSSAARVQSSSHRSSGNFGSNSYSVGGGSSAPIFGRIRITQSVERDSRGGDLTGGYVPMKGYSPVHIRRYSLSTDRDKGPLNLSYGGTRASLPQSSSSSFLYSRRASVASSTIKPYTPLNQYHAASFNPYRSYRGETGDANSLSYVDGFDSGSFADYRSGVAPTEGGIPGRRSVRASSVSNYEYGSRGPSVSRYEIQNGRSPSATRYEDQNSYMRASSVTRYENRASIGRASSVTRYEARGSIGRAPSVSRYDAQPSPARAPSVSSYETQTSFTRPPSVPRYDGPIYYVRASSVSRQEGGGSTSLGRMYRSASVSRYDRPRSFDNATEFGDLGHGPDTRARSVSRIEHQYESTVSTPVGSFAADDDSAYELRRQLRALRNQQIRAGSVTHHDRQEHAVSHYHHHHHHHQEATTPHVIRPRSLSTSSSVHPRRYRVITLHTPVQVTTASNPPIITGHPEPTLYSAKVFRTLPGEQGENVGVSNTEMGFIDNREDITSYVLKPGEKFLPTDVSVSVLPSGKKAVTYTRFSQKGHGDQQAANAEIERIIRKTKHLQESMHTLEDFVKRNRSLFPDDIIIYQKIIFYLLSEAELIKMGEKPDAEIYGVKIRERLVAPIGTDVASILRRYYSRHKEVDVEYEHPEVIRQQLKMTEAGGDIKIPYKGKRFDDDFDLVRPGHVPHEWIPSRSSGNALYIDEDELKRGGVPVRAPSTTQRPSAPEFTHRLRPQRAAVGQAIRLSCSVSAFPEAVVTWYRGKQEIMQNGRFAVKNVSGLCTLTISDITPDDSVLYTARAVNSEGEAITSALLDVYDLREEVATRQPPARKLSSEPTSTGTAAAGRRPFFLLEARNLWADVGERAVFEVQAAGKPLPSFAWVRDDVPVTEDDQIQIVSDGYGNCKLVIREIRSTDFGTYRCLAKNNDGTIESIASLFCVGNESVRPGQALKNELRSSAGQHKGRQPQFVHVPASRIDVREGEPLTLQCVVDGDPKPLVTWYKGVRELTYTGRHRVLEERNNCYIMQIKSTLATDSGEYTVTAHNLCGLVEYVLCVNVLPAKQETEDYDSNWKRPELTPLEYEVVAKTRQGKMPPIFVKKLPREKQMKVGASLKFDCYVEETKPKEYLVDVDIVLKDSKKENALSENSIKPSRPANVASVASPSPADANDDTKAIESVCKKKTTVQEDVVKTSEELPLGVHNSRDNDTETNDVAKGIGAGINIVVEEGNDLKHTQPVTEAKMLENAERPMQVEADGKSPIEIDPEPKRLENFNLDTSSKRADAQKEKKTEDEEEKEEDALSSSSKLSSTESEEDEV